MIIEAVEGVLVFVQATVPGTMPKKKKRYHSYAALFGQRRFCKQREGIVCERLLLYLIFIITDKARARRGVRYKVSVL